MNYLKTKNVTNSSNIIASRPERNTVGKNRKSHCLLFINHYLDRKLHIISLDIPYPADYGGVIDIFYKLRSLHEAGVEITLHCFQYGNRTPQAELKKYCKDVFYYPRLTGWKGLDMTLPYIISSRRSKDLLANLVQDDAPILFEGRLIMPQTFH